MKLKRKPENAEIPTASMADIAFLLIIFFMVTAVFSATKGLEFKLPQDEQNQPPEEEEATFIKVEADSSLTVDCTPMELEEILDYLEERLRRNPEKPVILYTDAYAPYQAMISVYDVLGSAEKTRGFKVKNISVPTQSEVAEYIELFGFNPFESQCAG
ncbi:MAG TPA: biopolymer transporter ExbD [Candidatus Polarisedimenticolaceae bacterium]|nr:biopolymer transporter ExbD [Candidatus Polarisedimenticolaceae bacterium]